MGDPYQPVTDLTAFDEHDGRVFHRTVAADVLNRGQRPQPEELPGQ